MAHSVLYTRYVKENAPEWREKKEQVFWQRGERCEACGSRFRIDVHHLTYKRLGRERLSDLMVLCRKHHDQVHWLRRATAFNLRLCSYAIVMWAKIVTRPTFYRG